MFNKMKCKQCDKEAVWEYAPNSLTNVYCDDCVSRGCTCNYKTDTTPPEPTWEGATVYLNIDPELQEKDEQGRMFPCVEYDYSKFGFYCEPNYRYPCNECGSVLVLKECNNPHGHNWPCLDCDYVCNSCISKKENNNVTA